MYLCLVFKMRPVFDFFLLKNRTGIFRRGGALNNITNFPFLFPGFPSQTNNYNCYILSRKAVKTYIRILKKLQYASSICFRSRPINIYISTNYDQAPGYSPVVRNLLTQILFLLPKLFNYPIFRL